MILTLVLALSLAGCKEKNEVTVLSPNGSPAISLMYVEESKSDYNYKIDYVDGADPLSAAFTSKSYDFIFAPLNLGAKMYLNNENYKLLAQVVSCNYYFATSTTEDFTMASLQDKAVVIFGQSAVSGIIARYVLSGSSLDVSKMNITYVNSVADTASELIKDNTKVVLTAEPSLSVLEGKVSNLKSISILSEYTKISGNKSFPQAAVFVRSDIGSGIAKRFLTRLSASVTKINKNTDDAAKLGASIFTNFTVESLKTAIPRMSLEVTNAVNSKEECAAFFKMLNDVNPKIIGGDIDDSFYFEA